MTSPTTAALEHAIGPAGRLSIRLETTAVDLRGVDGDTVRVFAPGDDLERHADVIQTPGSLSIRAGRGLILSGLRRRGGPVPDLRIDVPFGAEVTVENGSGRISAAGLVGVQRYRGVSGDVALRDIGGDVTVDVISGDLDVTAVDSLALRARTVSGDLHVRSAAMTALKATTTSGGIKVAGRLVGHGPFEVTSVSGDAQLALAGDAVVAVSSAAGRVRNDLDRSSARGLDGRRTITLGHGGPTIAVRTLAGDVRLVPPVAVIPPGPPDDAAPAAAWTDMDRLAVLQALEREEIDVTEAGRRLEAMDANASGGVSQGAPSGAVR